MVAVNRVAAGLGLAPGESVADARARVPELHVGASDATGDARALEALADWAQRYAPIVALDRQSATLSGGLGGDAGLWIDATGCAHLFGGEEAMLLDLRHRLERLSSAPAPPSPARPARPGRWPDMPRPMTAR